MRSGSRAARAGKGHARSSFLLSSTAYESAKASADRLLVHSSSLVVEELRQWSPRPPRGSFDGKDPWKQASAGRVYTTTARTYFPSFGPNRNRSQLFSVRPRKSKPSRSGPSAATRIGSCNRRWLETGLWNGSSETVVDKITRGRTMRPTRL